MKLIDTHQHLVMRDRLGYRWTEDEPHLAGDFTRADYEALVAGRDVMATIFMETGVDDADYRREARLVARMIGEGEVPIRAQVASCRPEEGEGFEAWLEECGGLGVAGFRRILHVMPDDLSRTEAFRANIRRMGDAGYPFDICMLARQLPIAHELVSACPQTQFVLDHCGVPDIAGNDFDAWRRAMARLADHANLSVKLSGLPAYCGDDAGIENAVRPYVEETLALFGPERVVWGGDWPVVNKTSGLAEWIAVTRNLLNGLSASEKARIGHDNAAAIYRVG
ncbi:amidohydrolase [Fulvimarina endophytica]|uniref:Amidohydrolase n=1 Tax=Fulvimarina endophytica TaxID=2293836 RepID=A0A371WYE3_9HYPH|nr:amidohydrolase [Fulvimarina endophytica]RFC62001.1 amidohydrolase [Fulvimarina endophytica]